NYNPGEFQFRKIDVRSHPSGAWMGHLRSGEWDCGCPTQARLCGKFPTTKSRVPASGLSAERFGIYAFPIRMRTSSRRPPLRTIKLLLCTLAILSAAHAQVTVIKAGKLIDVDAGTV